MRALFVNVLSRIFLSLVRRAAAIKGTLVVSDSDTPTPFFLQLGFFAFFAGAEAHYRIPTTSHVEAARHDASDAGRIDGHEPWILKLLAGVLFGSPKANRFVPFLGLFIGGVGTARH